MHSGNQQNARKGHADPRPPRRAPSQSGENQEIDRGIFQKVDAIGEQRYGANRQRDGKLNPEVRQVDQRRHEADDAVESIIGVSWIHGTIVTRCRRPPGASRE